MINKSGYICPHHKSYLITNGEFGNLLAIPDNYPKYVVSLDEWTAGGNYEGIPHLHLLDFLQRKKL